MQAAIAHDRPERCSSTHLSAFLVRDRGRYRGNPAPWAGKRRRYGALLPRKICSEHGSNIAK
jgi:hypothetical protein